MNKFLAHSIGEKYFDFSFSSLEEYEHKMEGVSLEMEFQFLDGDLAIQHFFKIAGVNQRTIQRFLEIVDEYENGNWGDYDLAAFAYYLDYRGEDLMDLDRETVLDSLYVFEGTDQEFAEDFLENSGVFQSIPEYLHPYIDVESYASDLQYSGDIYCFSFGGKDWVVQYT